VNFSIKWIKCESTWIALSPVSIDCKAPLSHGDLPIE
jgi:hypothetical protein